MKYLNTTKLIIGGDSQIGSALAKYWRKNKVRFHASTRRIEQISTERPYINLATKYWADLEPRHYNAVVFCAAVTKLVDCEKNPVKTYAINVKNTLSLAYELSSKVDYLLLISTNQVFDGSRPYRSIDEPTCPVNEYGRQKSETEAEFLRWPNSGILRLTKVIHKDWPLIKQWESELEAGKKIYAFSDMSMAPVSIENVVKKIDKLTKKQKPGIHHLSGKKDISYHDFAVQIFCNRFEASLIEKSQSKQSGQVQFSVPRYTTLKLS